MGLCRAYATPTCDTENITNNRHAALANEARHFLSRGVLPSPALKFSGPIGFGSLSSCLLPVLLAHTNIIFSRDSGILNRQGGRALDLAFLEIAWGCSKHKGCQGVHYSPKLCQRSGVAMKVCRCCLRIKISFSHLTSAS